MATTDYNAELDVPFVREFGQFLSNDELREWLENAPICAIGSGILQRDRMMEMVTADQSGGRYTVVSKDAYDFSNGDDMKTVTVNYRQSGSKFGTVIITAIKNKVGKLRVVALDPKTGKFRYFIIWDYESVRNYNRIEFSANPNSKSKYTNGQCGIELNSFKELACFE